MLELERSTLFPFPRIRILIQRRLTPWSRIFLNKLISAHTVVIFPSIMEYEFLLFLSKEPITETYLEPDESSPYSHFPFFKILFNIIFSYV
jgi:hypothetical protein